VLAEYHRFMNIGPAEALFLLVIAAIVLMPVAVGLTLCVLFFLKKRREQERKNNLSDGDSRLI
jgi:hypothetical protein